MKFKDLLKTKLRSFLGLQQIQEQINQIDEVNKLGLQQIQEQIIHIEKPLQQINDQVVKLSQLQEPSSKNEQDNKSEKFVIELDYPPSRDYRRRWGETHPPHQGLIKLFNKNRSKYIELLNQVAELKPLFDKIDRNFSYDNPGEPGWLGGAINAIDTALLYYFIKELKPSIYLEIGSGITTLFAARAKRDGQLNTRIVSIDPDPRTEVDAVCDEVIRAGLETTDLSIFADLKPGDIVFMDGSHRSFMNSDVTVFMLDVLPLLKPGVVIHVHDIHLPFDYPDMFKDWYWNEQYILAAYLLGAEDKIDVLMPSRFMSYTDELKQSLQPILEDWNDSLDVWLEGGSIWFTHAK